MNQQILGVDAAWTARGNTGVALIRVDDDQATLLKAAPTYSGFVEDSPGWRDARETAHYSLGDVLERTGDMDLVALDIPLAARTPVSRRFADNEISRAYGARGASTHSPLPGRPGRVARRIYATLVESGYRHMTARDRAVSGDRVFIETYPHPVIIDLMGLDYRLPYKVRNRGRYWPELSAWERWGMVAEKLDDLRSALAGAIRDVNPLVPSARDLLDNHGPSLERTLQALEDTLDAIVCAYAGWQIWRGHGVAFGDQSAAIWLPAEG